MEEKILVIANWKMNPRNAKEAGRLFETVRAGIRGSKNTETVFCPPFIFLETLAGKLAGKKSGAGLGAQDCFWQETGAYTGEVSVPMLKDLGCRYVICGHSERRENLAETDEMVNKKVRAALAAGLRPILCVGERSRQVPDYEKFIQQEIEAGLANVSRGMVGNVIVAYEPIWAIGSGNPATPDDALAIGLLIKKTLARLYSRPLAERVKIIYGGSVNSQNAKSYATEAGLKGLLVGGVSLDAGEFVKLIKSFD